MNKRNTPSNPYKLQQVILAPVSDEIQLDENLEPPFVRVRAPNSTLLFLDTTSNSSALQNPADRIFTLVRSVPRINRLSLTYLSFRWFSPNINLGNNVFTFERNGIPFTATLPTPVNFNGLARFQLLATAMSTAVGIPGEFTAAVSANFINTFTISASVGNVYRFTPIGNGIMKGRYLWGFNENHVSPIGPALNTHNLTVFTENYTRYIDIRSFELTQYSKIDSSGLNISPETIIRYNVNTSIYGDYEFTSFQQSRSSINYDRSRSISNVDVQIIDEFGELLSIPEQYWGSFSLSLNLICEL